jgi:hypothetical protein
MRPATLPRNPADCSSHAAVKLEPLPVTIGAN